MRRARLVMTACVCALVFSVAAGSAENRAQGDKTGAAVTAPVAPGDEGGKSADTSGGCPADGSCCGAPECRHEGAGAAGQAANAEGGCPCMKNRQQKPAS